MSQSNNDVPRPFLNGPTATSSDSNHAHKRGSSTAPDGNVAANLSNHAGGGFYATSSFPGLCVTSEEINFLVYRYLQESGFVHSAFTFAFESSIAKNSFKNADVPPGALITFLQKGLQYLGIEENLNDDGSERKRKKRKVSSGSAIRNNSGTAQHNSDEDSNESLSDPDKFSLLSPHACRALGRKNPPIRLNVPPATAAAAVTAKMVAEKAAQEKNKSQKNDFASKRNASGSAIVSESTNGNLQASRPKNQFPQYPSSSTISPGRSNPSSSFNAAAAAAAMSQLHQQGKNISPALPAMGTGSNVFSGPHRDSFNKVNVGNLPVTDSTGVQTQNAPVGQPLNKSSDNFMNSLSSVNNSIAGAGFKSGSGKSKSKLKNAPHQPSTGPASQSNPLPKQNSPFHSIPASFANQPSFSAALDEAAGRIEANAKAIKMERENSMGTPASQQRVQALVNAAAAGSLVGGPSLNTVRAQNAAVPGGGNMLGNAVVSSTFNSKNTNTNHPSTATHDFTKKIETLRNSSVPGRQFFGPGMVPRNNNTQHTTHPPIQSQNVSQQNSEQNVDTHGDLDDTSTQILPSEIVELSKHTSEVFMCSWNQMYPFLIATGSGDASARIWQMNGPTAKSGCGTSRLLKHGNPTDKNKDVTTLEWSPDGNQLATGSYDGVARVWRRSGELVHTLRTHRGPIFSLKWNKRGNFLLSGSYDKTTIVWDVSGTNAFVKQQFDHHCAPALDVDWKDDHTFASCSTDKSVHICSVGAAQPLFTYTGHTDEVNAVKWDPSGTLLASCSDDCTAKVWDVSRSRNVPLYDFKSHKQEIYTVKWSPTGKGSPNPTKPLMLATASFDGTVRLWNIQNGTCIRILSRHRDSVYSVSFSPSGEYLASGSLAGQLYIWNVQDGNHVKSYKGEGDIFEVAWNKDETRVAACFSSNVVAVIDFKM